MDFDQEDAFLEKYGNKYVIVSTNKVKLYGKVDGIERACNSDSGNTEIEIEPVDKNYYMPVDETEIVSIEVVSKEDCIGKDEEAIK